jgi:WD40 repeat protein
MATTDKFRVTSCGHNRNRNRNRNRNCNLSRSQSRASSSPVSAPASASASAFLHFTVEMRVDINRYPTDQLSCCRKLDVSQATAAHEQAVNALAAPPSGAWVATGSSDCTLKLWPIGKGFQPPMTASATCAGHRKSVTSIAPAHL